MEQEEALGKPINIHKPQKTWVVPYMIQTYMNAPMALPVQNLLLTDFSTHIIGQHSVPEDTLNFIALLHES